LPPDESGTVRGGGRRDAGSLPFPCSPSRLAVWAPADPTGWTMTSDSDTARHGLPAHQGKRRIQARVALALLEAMRDSDRPGEILDDENVTETLPRRFGLSGVVRSQIMRYEQEARKGRRVPQAEVADLIRLVIRRPDADDLFFEVGRSLNTAGEAAGWRRIFPARLAYAMARRRVARRLHSLFGGPLVRSAGVPFQIEAADSCLMIADPGGGACALVTGLSQAMLETSGRGPVTVGHPECRARGAERCLWTADFRSTVAEGEGPPTAA